ncbi:hypothetical protein QFC20_007082 [Naganishia adeliensis]|uniref:Uncharacterized protein n=1 Tax=Naganishia adeliensis TaxID=92952 RepID=A0ACC2V2Q3_9TREE|nr:hypothetical protein QFC20_007082 [Naganishia adeliensis]
MSGPPVGNGSYPTSSQTHHNGHHYATDQPVHPVPYSMNEQHGFAPSPSSTFGQGISNTASDPSVREVLGVYPFMQYTPSARVAKHLSSLTIAHPAIPTLEQQHPQYEQEFARLSNPTTEADYAFWNANMREAERLIATYGTGIGGGAPRGSGLAGSVASDLSSGRAQHRQPNLTYTNYHIPPMHQQGSSTHPGPSRSGSYFAESFLSKIVPPVSTPFGHPIPNEHYYAQNVETATSSNGSQEKVTPISYFNQYVEDITAQRLSQAQAQPQQQQRTPSQPSFNAHGLPVRGMSQSVQIGPRAVSHSTPRSAGSQSVRPQSAQQILEGLQNMSQAQPKRGAETALPRPAVTTKQQHVPTPVSVQPMDVDDPFVMDSSPSKGRSLSQGTKPKALGNGASSGKPNHLPPPPPPIARTPTPAVAQQPKPKAEPTKEGIRSLQASYEEEEGDSEDAEGEPDEEDDDVYTPGNERGKMVVDSGRPDKVIKIVLTGSIRSSARPGSTKIDHAHKLRELVDNIFDEEDSAPPNIREQDVSGTHFFSRTIEADDGTSRLVLSASTLEKLSNSLLKALPRPSRKKLGIQATTSDLSVGGMAASTPVMSTTKSSAKQHTSEGLKEWDDDDIVRLFRLLKRTMADAESATVFPDDEFDMRKTESTSVAAETPSPTKGGKPAKKKVKTLSPSKNKVAKVDFDPAKVAGLQHALEKLGGGVSAAGICLSILATGELPKQLYSEDLLITCMDTVRKAVEHVVLPFIEALSNQQAITSHALAYIINNLHSQDSVKVQSHLANLVAESSTCLTHLANLVCNVDFPLPDGMIFKMSSLSIKIVFSTEPPEGKEATAMIKTALSSALGGRAGLKSFKAGAMNVMKALFPRQSAEQRDSIIDEILSSVFKVAEMKKAQTHIRLRNGQSIHFISALLLELLQSCAYNIKDDIDAVRRKASLRTMTMDSEDDAPANSTEAEESRIFKRTIDLIEKSSFAVVNYLLRKSTVVTAGRGGRSASDNDYRAIFETYLQDQISVLYMPEWPVASLSLSVSAKLMMRALDETRSSPEITIGRAIAIEHLGALATRLRAFAVQQKEDGHHAAQPLPLILANFDIEAWKQLDADDGVVNSWLCKRSSGDILSQHAIQLNTAQRGLEMQQAIQRLSFEEIEDMPDDKKAQALSMLNYIQDDYKTLNNASEDDSLFDPESLEEAKSADAASCRLQSTRTLQTAYPVILNSILTNMHASLVAQRTKAIRALGSLITVDPEVLLEREIKASLRDRFADSSPAVRDAVIDLVGKYILLKPDVATEYYPLISARLADTGLGVRKRVIKLLKGMYTIIDQQAYRVDTCCRLVGMVADQDEGVKESAIAALADIWFGDIRLTAKGDTPRRSSSDTDSNLKDTAQMIVATLRRYSDSPGPIAEVIEQIAKNKTMLEKYAELVDVMLESLLENSGRSVTETLHLVQAIHLFSKAIPQIITVGKATALLPYLRPASSPDQVSLTETLLRMLCISIPHMPKTSVTFAQDLSKLLLPMIGRPGGKLSTLEETVACYCIVVRHITEEYGRVASILTSCITKLQRYQDACDSGKEPSTQEQKSIPFFIIISSLMVSSCDLDTVKADREGVIFRAYPTMMLEESSTNLMDQCFSTDATSPETVLRMLTLLHDCLSAEKTEVEPAGKSGRNQKTTESENIDISKLIGNTSNFAESGVNSAIVQRYLDKILESSLSVFADIQKVAMDILALTIDQGLAHPMQSVPVLISLETSENEAIAEKAFGLHSILQNKHASIINTRYLESCRGGNPAVALLERWYGLVREKRIWKQDFLKQMCRAFDFDASQPDISIDTVQLHVFIADNLALFDYKTMEEVFQVLQQLKQLLSVSGQQVVYNLPKLEAEDDNSPIEEASVVEEDTSLYQGDGTVPTEALRRAGLTIAIALMIRARLKKTYGLTEDKCTKVIVGTKKTAAADKPAHKKVDTVGNVIDWDSVPAVLRGMRTVTEYNKFREALIDLADQDGSIEVNDEDDMDDDDSKDEDY